jgi:hypothetical protein
VWTENIDSITGTGLDWAYRTFVESTPSHTLVNIDIKPGNEHNPFNPRSKGMILVAIISTNKGDGEAQDFDALQVDPMLVRFGPDEAATARYRVKDVDHDGDADLLLYFRAQQTGIACGDTESALAGETYDGQAITGTDTIKTVGCNKK